MKYLQFSLRTYCSQTSNQINTIKKKLLSSLQVYNESYTLAIQTATDMQSPQPHSDLKEVSVSEILFLLLLHLIIQIIYVTILSAA